jgi:hypothetical protein
VLVLTVVLALGAAAVLLALVMLLVEPEPIAGLGTGQRQDAESAVYLLTVAALLPASLFAGPQLARRIERGANGAALSALAALLACALAAAVLLVRVSIELGVTSVSAVLLVAGLCWWALAAGLLVRSSSERDWPALRALASVEAVLWVALGVLVFVCLLAVTRRDAVQLLPLAITLLAVAPLTALVMRHPPRRLRGRLGGVIDGLVIVLLLLAVPDMVVISPDAADATALSRFIDGVVQFHHDFLLGPANQVLGGDSVLVETASQYGVASIWFLAGWFQLVPIGYGTFGLLDGLLTALTFVGAYGVMRMAGVSRLLAAVAMALAVAVLVYAREYPVGSLPQEGPLRFGLPLLAILAVVAAARFPRRGGLCRGLAVAVLGLSSIWSIESFATTAVTLAALACAEAALLAPAERVAALKRRALLGLVACVCAHVILALWTLARSGVLPDWGQYLAFLEAFLVGGLGDVTYDFARFSPGLAVAAAYLIVVAAVVLLVRELPGAARREPATTLALAGTAAYGVTLYYYFVDRSAVHVLVYVCLPLLMACAIWLALVLRNRDALPRGVAHGAVAFASAVCGLLVAVAWSSIGPSFERSALAHAPPGGRGLRAALDRLWDFPPVNPSAPSAERMLARHMPGERRTLVLIQPSMITEVLMSSGRSNRLPLADPFEDGFVESERRPGLRRAVAELEEGERLLLDDAALAGLAAVKRDPGSRLLDDPSRPLEGIQPGAPTAQLQLYTLLGIDRRFRMRTVARRDGFVVVELRARR